MDVFSSLKSTMLGKRENQSMTLFSQRSEFRGMKNISMIRLGILGKGKIKTEFDYSNTLGPEYVWWWS